MNRKTYRICIIMILVLAAATGILYYRAVRQREIIPKEGTFVYHSVAGSASV